MNLRQLQYVLEIARNGLSVSKAARSLNTSQPGISQQIRSLEAELGIDIFTRDKNRLTGLTVHGQSIVEHAEVALFNIQHINAVARAMKSRARKELVVATTHTKARYLLPSALKMFLETHPGISVTVNHGNPIQIMDDLATGLADVGLGPSISQTRDEIAILPFREDERVLIVPKGHPLLGQDRVTLTDISQHPLITYHRSIESHAVIAGTFASAGIAPNIVLRAIDSGVIKRYVEEGMGVAILPRIAYSAEEDRGVCAIPIDGSLPPSITCIYISQVRQVGLHVLDFIRILSPKLTQFEIMRLNVRQLISAI
jgi:LysR family cys regulon transcriptional activator